MQIALWASNGFSIILWFLRIFWGDLIMISGEIGCLNWIEKIVRCDFLKNFFNVKLGIHKGGYKSGFSTSLLSNTGSVLSRILDCSSGRLFKSFWRTFERRFLFLRQTFPQNSKFLLKTIHIQTEIKKISKTTGWQFNSKQKIFSVN